MHVVSNLRICLGAVIAAGACVVACASTTATTTAIDDGGAPDEDGASNVGPGSSSGSPRMSSSSSSGAANGSSSGAPASSSTSSGGTGPGSTSSSGSGGGSSTTSSSTSSSGAASSSGGSSSGASAADAGGSPGSTDGAGDAGACPAGLQDKTTTCTGTEPACAKGCGPDLASGTLGSKTCTCNTTTLVFDCLACVYPQPLPACYQPALNDAGVPAPPACAAGVADKVACTTPCSGVCTTPSDAGKTRGCVCVQLATGGVRWTCQTQWW